jgi:hypothetical protein
MRKSNDRPLNAIISPGSGFILTPCTEIYAPRPRFIALANNPGASTISQNLFTQDIPLVYRQIFMKIYLITEPFHPFMLDGRIMVFILVLLRYAEMGVFQREKIWRSLICAREYFY